jgi:hypothetical protein
VKHVVRKLLDPLSFYFLMAKGYKRLVFILGQFWRVILQRIREAHFVSFRFSGGSPELTFLRFDSPVDLGYHCRHC